MTLDPASGIWSYSAPAASLYGKYYLYEAQVYVRSTNKVETNVVTDPYSVSLARNSTRSQIVSLDDPELQPRGWRNAAQAAPGRARRHRAVRAARARLQRHRRDRAGGPARHLRGVHAEALGRHEAPGDCWRWPASRTCTCCRPSTSPRINEDKSTWQCALVRHARGLPPDSSEQQALVAATADRDGFNWGYDPLHYNVPEGSYATDPDGSERILEFRQMVQSLNQSGLRVVMDVVYNHTNSRRARTRTPFSTSSCPATTTA